MVSVDEKLEKDACSDIYEDPALVGQSRILNPLISIVDGFRRAENPASVIHTSDDVGNGESSRPKLQRRLKSRHLQMVAIGGCIGSGLFVGPGSAPVLGGPASLLIAFTLVGVMLFCTIHALGEMAVIFPVAGSFSAYSTRFLDPAWGFCYGLKLRDAVACDITSGDNGGQYYS